MRLWLEQVVAPLVGIAQITYENNDESWIAGNFPWYGLKQRIAGKTDGEVTANEA
jgi:hypothetical protein